MIRSVNFLLITFVMAFTACSTSLNRKNFFSSDGEIEYHAVAKIDDDDIITMTFFESDLELTYPPDYKYYEGLIDDLPYLSPESPQYVPKAWGFVQRREAELFVVSYTLEADGVEGIQGFLYITPNKSQKYMNVVEYFGDLNIGQGREVIKKSIFGKITIKE